jgi:hypothetical protein
MYRPEAEVPEIVLQLLREAWRRGAPASGVTIRRTMSSWIALWGNQALVTPSQLARGPQTWRLIEYPPPRKPISEIDVEVGP